MAAGAAGFTGVQEATQVRGFIHFFCSITNVAAKSKKIMVRKIVVVWLLRKIDALFLCGLLLVQMYEC